MTTTRRAYRGRVGGPRLARFVLVAAVAGIASVTALGACSDEPQAGQVDASAAIVAMVDWQVAEWEPPPDADEGLLPVIYIVGADGGTIDIAVQAAVAEATVDDAVVIFADKAGDAFDPDVEGSPVRDDGVMLAIGPIPEPARRMRVDVDVYHGEGEGELYAVQIASRQPTEDDPRRAEVTTTTSR